MAEAWMTDALCRHFPTLAWIVEPEDRSQASTAALSTVCLACPVRSACDRYVGRRGVVSGFWAGSERSPAEDNERADGVA